MGMRRIRKMSHTLSGRGNATFVDIVGFCLWIDLLRDESERLSWFDGTIAAFNLSLADVLCPVWAYLPDF